MSFRRAEFVDLLRDPITVPFWNRLAHVAEKFFLFRNPGEDLPVVRSL